MSKDQRSRLMAKVRGRDTGIEVRLRKELWREGFRYRIDHKVHGIKVDLAFPRYRLVVFVDGCFWHGCPTHYTVPKSSREFWAEKLRANVERDRRQTKKLEDNGWRVVRVLEHSVKTNPEVVVSDISKILVSGRRPRKTSDWRVISVEQGKDHSEIWTLEDLREGSMKRVERKAEKSA